MSIDDIEICFYMTLTALYLYRLYFTTGLQPGSAMFAGLLYSSVPVNIVIAIGYVIALFVKFTLSEAVFAVVMFPIMAFFSGRIIYAVIKQASMIIGFILSGGGLMYLMYKLIAPQSFADCLIQHSGSAQNNFAYGLVVRACRLKFPH